MEYDQILNSMTDEEIRRLATVHHNRSLKLFSMGLTEQARQQADKSRHCTKYISYRNTVINKANDIMEIKKLMLKHYFWRANAVVYTNDYILEPTPAIGRLEVVK